jgi:hypothetical protein
MKDDEEIDLQNHDLIRLYLSSSPNVVPISLAVAKRKQKIINNPHVILPSGIGIVVYEFDCKTLIEI